MMIYIVRHGETQWNADGRIQGRRDIELNENGRRQAEAAAEALRGKSFQALITSPLSRAKQTGAILAQFAQIAEVREDARIVERDFGELDGARFTEDVRHRLYQEKVQGPRAWKKSLRAWPKRLMSMCSSMTGISSSSLTARRSRRCSNGWIRSCSGCMCT